MTFASACPPERAKRTTDKCRRIERADENLRFLHGPVETAFPDGKDRLAPFPLRDAAGRFVILVALVLPPYNALPSSPARAALQLLRLTWRSIFALVGQPARAQMIRSA